MLLRKGSQGEKVKQLQEKLGLYPDGIFGSDTEKHVKAWQRKNNLVDDGLVGNVTWSKMFPPKIEKIDISKLKGHVSENVLDQLSFTIEKFNIINKLRLSHFLSQCAHESGGFKFIKENLNYSEKALTSIFGKYFKDVPASKYARNPEMIASRVYANRMGNGSESTKEGWKFRGRGYIQLTGKVNYEKFSKFIGEDCVANPDLVSDKYPLASAAFFFDSNNLWPLCDQGSSDEIVKKVTRRVNGGYHGLDDRLDKFKKYWNLLK